MTAIQDAINDVVASLDRMAAAFAAHTPTPDPADASEALTDEPGVGAWITDADGNVWMRRLDGLWVADHSQWTPGNPWAVVCAHAPLRPATPADLRDAGIPEDQWPEEMHGDWHVPHEHPCRCDFDRLRERAETAERAVTEWRAAFERMARERDEARHHHEALRADVEREYAESSDYPTARILDADDKRGRDE